MISAHPMVAPLRAAPLRARRRVLHRPLEDWSERALWVTLGLGLSPRQWRAALGALEPQSADGLRFGVTLERLVVLARTQPIAPAVLANMLEQRLQGHASRFRSASFMELARTWSRARATLSGVGLAALVWTVARRRDPAFRRLELHLLDDIEAGALCALRTHGTRGVFTAAARTP